jgi:hypothetical protein
VDDSGAVSIVAHDRAGAQLAGRLERGIDVPGARLRRRRLLPGIMVDSQAFARADARAVTLARLDWQTLRRLHTPRDARAGLTFGTARALGTWLASVRG